MMPSLASGPVHNVNTAGFGAHMGSDGTVVEESIERSRLHVHGLLAICCLL